jgi:hypothetical protein
VRWTCYRSDVILWTVLGTLGIVAAAIAVGVLADRRFGLLPRPWYGRYPLHSKVVNESSRRLGRTVRQ